MLISFLTYLFGVILAVLGLLLMHKRTATVDVVKRRWMGAGEVVLCVSAMYCMVMAFRGRGFLTLIAVLGVYIYMGVYGRLLCAAVEKRQRNGSE